MAAKKAVLHTTRKPAEGECSRRDGRTSPETSGTAIDLSYQAKQAHWNVKGMNFIAVHELFDRLHEEVEVFVDDIAERLTAMGGQAQGTVHAASANTLLDPYPLDLVKSEEHLKRLTESYSTWGRAVLEGIKEADEAGDDLTADLLTSIGRDVDTSIYFLESHFQA